MPEGERWENFTEAERAVLMLGITGAIRLVNDLKVDEDVEAARDIMQRDGQRMLAELSAATDAPPPPITMLLKSQLRSDRPEPTDPRLAGGEIIEKEPGATDPYARDTVEVDTRRAVLLDDMWVTAMLGVRDGEVGDRPDMAVQLGGRINKTDERASILYLMNEDGAAALISELMGVVSRMGPEYRERLLERLADMPL